MGGGEWRELDRADKRDKTSYLAIYLVQVLTRTVVLMVLIVTGLSGVSLVMVKRLTVLMVTRLMVVMVTRMTVVMVVMEVINTGRWW